MAKDYQQMYREKLRTAEEVAREIQSGALIDYAMFNGKPVALDAALAARKDELQNITIYGAVTVPPVSEVVLRDPLGDVFTYNDQHFSALTRILQEKCQGVFYSPVQYGEGALRLG